MEALAVLLVLISIIGWIVGMIKPSLVLRWGKKRNRLRLTLYCFILFFVGLLIMPVDETADTVAQNASEQSEQEAEQSKEDIEKQQAEGNKEQTTNTAIVAVPAAVSTANSNGQDTDATEKTNQESQSKPNNVPAGAIPAKVTRVIDGDTFEATVQGKTEKVRMILVDTPETVHPDKPAEPYGKEASDFTKQMLEGKDVYLELDAQERDQYGRLLAYVWIGDKLYNKMLLEKGFARVAVYPPNVKYVDEFRAVQKKAQEQGIGIWSVENYAQEEKKQQQTAKKTETAKAETTKTETKKESSSSSKSTKQQAASKDTARCADPKIKGNINSKGEKIYHVPGGAYYDRTIPEEWFCTEEEAQQAGYRPSKR